MNRRIIGACLAGAVSLTASGCAQRIDGTAIALDPPKPVLAANTTTVDFDPCIDISDSTLRRSGLNPSTEYPAADVGGCEWTAYAGWYGVGIQLYDFSIAEADTSEIVVERRTRVGGRPAVVFTAVEPVDSECGVAIDVAHGSVVIFFLPDDRRPFAESCDVALMHASDVVADVPA